MACRPAGGYISRSPSRCMFLHLMAETLLRGPLTRTSPLMLTLVMTAVLITMSPVPLTECTTQPDSSTTARPWLVDESNTMESVALTSSELSATRPRTVSSLAAMSLKVGG
eukprot:CAMPEP_0183356946 /NCGR_PEP_ID=MMETSP0164_2-20130417/45287_1 /TAXON_ID=221442 /ORGANISM="Coccolithus pelagicus ssp braarudi, Strain PLY182g" /LENGTH=110 /DNA_ID=CAMNT_0025530471 /DNA_START=147 /DNA_END=479 /DNA_ORIENTATION=+